MSEIRPISAELRQRAGKGAARATRRAGRIPAVIYGNKQDTVLISLEPVEFSRELKAHGFFSHIFEITVKGDGTHRALARDVQFHPVTDQPLHVDFMRFSASTKLHVDVEIEFINEAESPGMKRGGVLNVVNATLEVVCAPDVIPETLVVDLTGLKIGDSVHLSDIKLPEGVHAVSEDNLTIVTIATPTLMTVEEEASETEAEAAGTTTVGGAS